MDDPKTDQDRQQWTQQAEMRLRKLQTEIRDLESRLVQRTQDVDRRLAVEILEALRSKRDFALLKLNAIRSDTDIPWNTLQIAVDAAWDDLEAEVQRAREFVRTGA